MSETTRAPAETDFDWNDVAVARLKELAPTGLSAAQIARQLVHELGGKVSRNAVCGKAARLKISIGNGIRAAASNHGLEGRIAHRNTRQSKPPAPPRARPPVTIAPRPRVPTVSSFASLTRATPEQAQQQVAVYLATPTRQRAFDPAHAPEGARLVKLDALGRGECKWPLYENGPMLFCGCAVNTSDRNGQPDVYCEAHMALRKPRVVQ